MSKHGPLMLVILDGWGYCTKIKHNAIAQAKTPNWDRWWASYPHTLLEASGQAVGLPDKQMGNSEVGHMHIGAGRLIPQDFTRINQAIESGIFFNNQILIDLIEQLKSSQKSLHIMGLLSSGGVHSHQDHLFAFLKLCHQYNFKSVYLHLFLDGRDTPPKSAETSLTQLGEALRQFPVAKIRSLSGRFYAMDRDKRWDRVKKVYDMLIDGHSEYHFDTAENALHALYEQDFTDEFIPPTLIGTTQTIQPEDAIFFFNFRADRARQLTEALTNPSIEGFKHTAPPKLSQFVSMTQYSEKLHTIAAYPPMLLSNTLGEVLAHNNLKQFRVAETEKYAHVTFFFNGGNEKVFADEKRILIPSPKVNTYDLKPEMSAFEIKDAILNAIDSDGYDVLIANFANADMVGHTGNYKATLEAIATLDSCMGEIWAKLKEKHGKMLITADHGNAEFMFDEKTDQVRTAHSSHPVPLLFLGQGWAFSHIPSASLRDIAPTMLQLLGINPPDDMTGTPLLEKIQ